MKRVIILLVAGTLVSAVGAVWASSKAASKAPAPSQEGAPAGT